MGNVSTLDQDAWWLVPFALLMVVMVYAMMELTASLLVKRPRTGRKPIAAVELRQRLLAVNESDAAHQWVEGQDCDLEIRWGHTETPPQRRLTITRAAFSGRLRVLLDEQRHELRVNEVTRSYFFFFGLAGWLPLARGYAGVQSGPPGRAVAEQLGHIANQGGWTVRPVLWWFQTTFRGYSLLNRLTPPPLRRWPARRFWGILYPLSYALGMGCVALAVGPLDRRSVLLLVAISAIWWGVWGVLAWMLCGFPTFWRRKQR